MSCMQKKSSSRLETSVELLPGHSLADSYCPLVRSSSWRTAGIPPDTIAHDGHSLGVYCSTRTLHKMGVRISTSLFQPLSSVAAATVVN